MADLVWNNKKVEECRQKIMMGEMVSSSPFWDNDPNWRAGNIVYEYTQEELEEVKKCMQDVVYFAEKYCYLMTDKGTKNVKLRDYQIELLRGFQEGRFSVVLSSRQVGKTTTSGIFLTWYSLFNFDKTALIAGNKLGTAVEIIDKIKNIMQYLPFFLKPGVIVNNQSNMKFDNNCRIIGQATTKTTGIGFSINLLYLDEFAHVPQNLADPLFRSMFPTLAAMQTSKLIITSTANGMNKFYDIYTNAVLGLSEFRAFRVDWWDVPGRDEEWKRKEIANLGSEEMFNQEYGNQFLSSSRLLLNSNQLKKIKANSLEFKWREIEALDDLGIDYLNLKWHPSFNLDSIDYDEFSRFVFSIDVSGGKGRDYSVINIFKLIPVPEKNIKKIKTYSDESDFFGLMQVGNFKSNQTPVDSFAEVITALLFRVFDPEKVKILMEMNFEGGFVLEKMSQHKDFWPEILIHTKHSEHARSTTPGFRLNNKNKPLYCMELKKYIDTNKIIITEKNTFEELSSFGLNKKGSFSSQIGHDDLAMTCVNLTMMFSLVEFSEMVEDVIDFIPDKYKKAINEQISSGEKEDNDIGKDFLRDLMN